MSLKFLILGCGPAGLMAAQAAHRFGHRIFIVSKARKSHMRGAQYLHHPIPGASISDPFLINYDLMGTPELYRDRVYGNMPGNTLPAPEETSAESLTGKHPAWDIREAYDNLWYKFGPIVRDGDLTKPGLLREIIDWCKPDEIISTIPAPMLCQMPDRHQFYSQSIWSSDREVFPLEDNHVLLCGDGTYAWYRAAKIHGWCTTEWPHEFRPPFSGIVEVVKPIYSSCSCWPTIHRMGRYGQWRKGVLSHSAFDETVELIHKPRQEELFQ